MNGVPLVGDAKVPEAKVSNPYGDEDRQGIISVDQARESWNKNRENRADDMAVADLQVGMSDNTTYKSVNKYEGLGVNPTIDMDFDELAAYEQGTYEKIAKGAVRLVGETALNVAEIPGSLVGGAMAALTGDINKMTDNFWVNTTDSMKESLKEALPIYQTEAVRNGNVWDGMTSLAWWMDEGTSGAAFMASAFAPGIGLAQASKIFSLSAGLSKFSKGRQVLTGLDKGAEALGIGTGVTGAATGAATKSGLNLLGGAVANTTWEASVEARMTQKDMLDDAEAKLKSGEISEEQYEQLRVGSAVAARNTFMYNVAILLGPNMIMSKLIMGPKLRGRGAAKDIKFNKGTQQFADETLKENAGEGAKGAWNAIKGMDYTGAGARVGRGAGRFASNTFREGIWEEGAQSAVGEYWGKGLTEEIISGDRKATLLDNYADVLMSPAGQRAALLSGVLSGGVSLYANKGKTAGRIAEKNTLIGILNSNLDGYKANLYNTVKGGFYKQNEEGEYLDANNNVVGRDQAILDNAKLDILGDSQVRVEEIEARRQQLVEAGRFQESDIVAAQLQVEALAPYIAAGGEGPMLLRSYLNNSQEVDQAIEDANEENPGSITKEQYISDEVTRLKALQKHAEYFDANVMSPISADGYDDYVKAFPETTETEYATARQNFSYSMQSRYMMVQASLLQTSQEMKKVEEDISAAEKYGDDIRVADLKTNLNELMLTQEYLMRQSYDIRKKDGIEKLWRAGIKEVQEQEEKNAPEVINKTQEVVEEIAVAETKEQVEEITEKLEAEGIQITKEPEVLEEDETPAPKNTEQTTKPTAEKATESSTEPEAKKVHPRVEEVAGKIARNEPLTEEDEAIRRGQAKEIEDLEWDIFVDTGKVSQNKVREIAEKIVSNKPLTVMERSIRSAYAKEIEEILKELKPAPKNKVPPKTPANATINKRGIADVFSLLLKDKAVQIDEAERAELNAQAEEAKLVATSIINNDELLKEKDFVYFEREGKKFKGQILSLYDSPKSGSNALINVGGQLILTNASTLSRSLETASTYNKESSQKKNNDKEAEAQGDYKNVRLSELNPAFVEWTRAPRDKTNDVLEFQLKPSTADHAVKAKRNALADPEISEQDKEVLEQELIRWEGVHKIIKKVQAEGSDFLLKDKKLLDFFMENAPMTIRTRSEGVANASSNIATKTQTGEWTALEGELRKEIFNTWILGGGKLKGAEGATQTKNVLVGVTGRVSFQKRGSLNQTDGAKNLLTGVRGFNSETAQLTVPIKDEYGDVAVYHRDGNIAPVSGLRTKGHEGRIFLEVKDNLGQPFHAALTNREFRHPRAANELKLLMRLIHDRLDGRAPNDLLSKDAQARLQAVEGLYTNADMTKLTYTEVMNTLVITGRATDATYLKVGIDAATFEPTVQVGKNKYNLDSFKQNHAGIQKVLGFKHQNVGIPNKTEIPRLTMSNMDYARYVFETGVLTTDIAHDAPIFVGDTQVYMGPKDISSPVKEEVKATPKKAAKSKGQRILQAQRELGLNPRAAQAAASNMLIDLDMITKEGVKYLNKQVPNDIAKIQSSNTLDEIKGYIEEDIKPCN